MAPPAAHRCRALSPLASCAMPQVVSPGDSQTVPGEGICGGDLIICFDILFPKTLTPAQKKAIKAVDM